MNALLHQASVPALILLSVQGFASMAHAAHELDDRNLAKGEELYAEHCAACHGAKLQGEPNWQIANEDGTMPAPPHDRTGHTWHHDNQLLFDYTRLGGAEALSKRGLDDFKSGMPGFSDVIDDEAIWDILAYIRSTWPARIQEIQTARNPPHE